MKAGEGIGAGVGVGTFASDRADMGGGGALLSTGGDVAVGFSRFLAWYFLSSRRKKAIPFTGSPVSSEYIFFSQ